MRYRPFCRAVAAAELAVAAASGTASGSAAGDSAGGDVAARAGCGTHTIQGSGNGWANSGGEDVTFTDDMTRVIGNALCVDTRFGGGPTPSGPRPAPPTSASHRNAPDRTTTAALRTGAAIEHDKE